VQRFVAATHDVVPAGQESSHVSIDDLVVQLLAR
jgi:hypothetical protein